MIVESIHIRFDEIKEVYEMFVANNTLDLVPQRQKASNYDNPDLVPQRQDVSSSADIHVSSQQELDLLFGPLYDEFFNADDDHAGCIDSRKSTSGGIQFLGDKLVNWMLKKQNCTAMSSAEAEYVALSTSCAQVMWMRTQLQDYGYNYNKIPLCCDSQTGYQLANMFTKALPEDRFKYLVRRIGRCLTPAELEVLVKESA
nr:copia protein [Tanacetum cinerariifolium]